MNIAVSIVMPFYNGEKYLREAIDSILNQTFKDFELLALDDGSTDASVSVVNSYNDSRIRLIQCEHNFIATLNHGLKEAKGKYIARMDADDITMPERLEKQYTFMETHSEVDVCGSWAEIFGEGEGTIQVNTDHVSIVSGLLLGNGMIHPTTMIRSATLTKYDLKYLEYAWAEDYKLWVDMALAGASFANLPEVLIRYRRSPSQVTQRNWEQMMKTTVQIRLEYAEGVMNSMCEYDERYLKLFDEAIGLWKSKLFDLNTLCQLIYTTYKHDITKGIKYE